MLVLASQSKSRQQLLSFAGVNFKAVPADIDEEIIKEKIKDSKEASLQLAVAKAEYVSGLIPEAYVIGADQILELNGKCYSKPADMNEAREHLKQFRGQTHQLVNGIAVVKNKKVMWSENTIVNVTMRCFSDDFLEMYLKKAGPSICSSVGAYYLEELGSQLIKSVEGDYFSVLGLPLLPLFDFLRSCGELEK